MLPLIFIAVISCKKETTKENNIDDLGQVAKPTPDPDPLIPSVFATGFNNPRGLKFGPDGNLYVAEAGIGGTSSTVGVCTPQVAPPFGPYLGSTTGGRISKVTMAGVRTTVTAQLPTAKSARQDILGPSDVAFINNTLYVVNNAGCSHGVASMPSGVYRIDGGGPPTLIANLSAWQAAHPVAHPSPGDFEPDGSWYGLIAVGNDLYALDANHGELVKISKGSVSRVVDFSATQGHIVPTAIDYHGNFYVANLGPFPIMGNSKIFKVNPAGQLHLITSGLSAVLGLVVDQQSQIYVLEMTTGTDFPTPGTGRILKIDANGGAQIIAEHLNFPTGMTMGPDGNLYVSSWGFGMPPGGGQVLKVTLHE